MTEDQRSDHDLGFYLLDDVPVVLRDGHHPETWDGVPIAVHDWMRRAVWIDVDEYTARVVRLRTPRGNDRS